MGWFDGEEIEYFIFSYMVISDPMKKVWDFDFFKGFCVSRDLCRILTPFFASTCQMSSGSIINQKMFHNFNYDRDTRVHIVTYVHEKNALYIQL